MNLIECRGAGFSYTLYFQKLRIKHSLASPVFVVAYRKTVNLVLNTRNKGKGGAV